MIKQNDLTQQLYLLKNIRSLNLKRYRYMPREKEEGSPVIIKGLSTYSFGDKWFLIGDKQSLFKTFDDGFYKEIREKRVLNELVCYRLATKLGMKAAPCQPAMYDDYDGIVSYSFLYDGDKIIVANQILQINENTLLKQNTFENFTLALPIYAQKNGVLLDDDVELDLFKMMVFDYLTVQEDRHLGNIVFIQDKNDGLRLAPLFDNEFSFAIAAKIADKDLSWETAHTKSVRMKPYENNIKSYKIEALDICEVSKQDDRYKEFLKKVFKFDIKSFFEKLDETISIDEEYKKQCIECFEFGQTALKNAFKKKQLFDEGEIETSDDEDENEL